MHGRVLKKTRFSFKGCPLKVGASRVALMWIDGLILVLCRHILLELVELSFEPIDPTAFMASACRMT